MWSNRPPFCLSEDSSCLSLNVQKAHLQSKDFRVLIRRSLEVLERAFMPHVRKLSLGNSLLVDSHSNQDSGFVSPLCIPKIIGVAVAVLVFGFGVGFCARDSEARLAGVSKTLVPSAFPWNPMASESYGILSTQLVGGYPSLRQPNCTRCCCIIWVFCARCSTVESGWSLRSSLRSCRDMKADLVESCEEAR